jgi:hypothetical protein
MLASSEGLKLQTAVIATEVLKGRIRKKLLNFKMILVFS